MKTSTKRSLKAWRGWLFHRRLWIDMNQPMKTACTRHRFRLARPARVLRPADVRPVIGCEAGGHQ